MVAPPSWPWSQRMLTSYILSREAGLGVSTNENSALVLTNYIGGAFVAAVDGRTLEDLNPATGRQIARIPRSSTADVDAAVSAAAAAFPSWRDTPTATRAALLDAIANAIEAHAPELAMMECQDSGKTLAMATTVDIPRSAANFRFFAGAVRHASTQAHAMHDAINYCTRGPLGVVACITPWNLPLYLLTWKVAPALACGNTVVAKPSEMTPRTASALARICHAVGLPPGVLNIVHGLGGEAGGPLVAHRDVKVVSFTGKLPYFWVGVRHRSLLPPSVNATRHAREYKAGGTATGRTVASIAAPLFKRLSLELGGKNATIVFADAARDSAPGKGGVTFSSTMDGVIRASFTNNGQVRGDI